MINVALAMINVAMINVAYTHKQVPVPVNNTLRKRYFRKVFLKLFAQCIFLCIPLPIW